MSFKQALSSGGEDTYLGYTQGGSSARNAGAAPAASGGNEQAFAGATNGEDRGTDGGNERAYG